MSTRCLVAVFDSVDDRDGVAVSALLQHGNVDGVLAVDAHDVGLNGTGVFGLADVGDHDRTEAHRFQGDAVDLLRVRHLAVGVNVVVAVADAHVTGGQNQVRIVHRVEPRP